MTELVYALILGVVEGITEFLPISSTGHLILASALLGATDERWKVFNIVIQTGAMLAVVWEYRARFFRIDIALYRNLAIAFIPAAVLGLAFSKYIKGYLFHAVPVALAFIVGGVVILLVERRTLRARVESTRTMTSLDALKVGCAQCFALIPGTSRSGATIIGGLLFDLSRTAATQFSFFLAMPTVIGATVYALYQARHEVQAADLPLFVLGFVTAFIAALFCVRWLLRYISNHDFRAFAWYRIVFGGVILLTAQLGWVNWTD